eukprot:Gb_41793 [translate_table: standard]
MVIKKKIVWNLKFDYISVTSHFHQHSKETNTTSPVYKASGNHQSENKHCDTHLRSKLLRITINTNLDQVLNILVEQKWTLRYLLTFRTSKRQ